MVRSSLFVRALGAAIGVPLVVTLALGAPAAHAGTGTPATAATRADEPEPLAITIDTMSPSAVPRTGPITLTGTVTNVDDETWSTISLYPFISETPIRTAGGLRRAVEVPVGVEVGGRIFRDVPLDQVAELAPGESYDYTIVVPRSFYTVSRAGVYWFGVHALAEGPVARDLVADGRARTFLPYVPERVDGAAETALVIPLRRSITFEADGSLARLAGWERALSDGGRLRELVDLAATSASTPVTWLIDPALPDVVRRLAAGNPPRSLSPTLPPDAEEPVEEKTDEPSPSTTLSTPPEEDDEGGDEAEGEVELAPEVAAVAEVATEWLADLRSALTGDQVLTLPYGDLDVAAAAEHDTGLFDLAESRTGAVLASWEVSTTPAFASPSGYLDPEALSFAPTGSTTLLTDRMFEGNAPAVADTGTARLVPLSSGAVEGGPLPGDPHAGVALRQRILSEAAVRLLEPEQRPLVVMFPDDVLPEELSGFFSGLQHDWVDLSTVAGVAGRPAVVVDPSSLAYPAAEDESELQEADFDAVEDLIDGGRRLETILTRNDQVSATVTNQALTGASYAAREAPRRARVGARASLAWITTRLESVQVDAPPGVTLSGGTGQFAVTVTNTLDQPVTVVVTSASDDGIEVSDSEPLRLARGSQTTVLLDVHTRRSGVHDVSLYLTNVAGDRIGSSDLVPIRSAQLSTVIWVIMASGAAILFLAVGARLARRLRHRHDPEPAP